MKILVGCDLGYQVTGPAPLILNIQPAETPRQRVLRETLTITPEGARTERWTVPGTGNRYLRIRAEAGMELLIHHEAEVELLPHVVDPGEVGQTAPADLPPEVLPHLWPSRFCESDRLERLALREFCDAPAGHARVTAVCNWVHDRIAYLRGASAPTTTATDTLLSGAGVCRDFAHLAVAAGLFAFARIAAEVTEGDTLAFDRDILLALRNPADLSDPIGPRWLEEAARDVTALGSHVILGYVTLAVVGFLLLSGRRASALFTALAIGGGMLVSSVLKIGFARPRPDLVPHAVEVYTASFPSGHAMLSAVAYLTLGALLMRVAPLGRTKFYVLAVAILTTLMVGISRVYLGVHWPTDVLAGWCGGAGWALLCWIVLNALQRRGAVEPKGTPEEPGTD